MKTKVQCSSSHREARGWSWSHPFNRGFTRTELAIVLASVALIGIVVWPVVAAASPDSHKIACQNNLRKIGRAFQEWAMAHGERHPWRVPINEGGTLLSASSSQFPNPRAAN